jgi:hypothetical protein
MRCLVSLVTTAAVSLLIALADEAPAAQIAYITTGVGSGTLGATPFTNQPFAVTAIAETSQVQDNPFSFGVNNISTTVQLGATSLTASPGSSYAAKNADPQFAAYFWSNLLVGDEIDTAEITLVNSGFFGFDLKTALGPVFPTDQGSFVLITNQGTLTFQSRSQVQFNATIVPEPSTLALAALVLGTPTFVLLRLLPRRRTS